MSAEQTSYLLGLVGEGIGASLTPAMQEREGRESGLDVSYRLLDAKVRGFGVDDLAELLAWAQRLGFDGLQRRRLRRVAPRGSSRTARGTPARSRPDHRTRSPGRCR